MPEFTVTVVDRPAISAAGLKVRTAMDAAGADCPALWEKTFGPKMASFPADPARPGESYGVCVMIDDNTFDYWAVMPLAKGAEVPGGMEAITVPGGLCGECRLASLKELTPAYTYMYTTWASSLKDYAVNMQAPAYEMYTADYMKNGSLAVYCPLVKQ
jgi:predicted transcriptional regulator YdeE